jgi:hypothetical protein
MLLPWHNLNFYAHVIVFLYSKNDKLKIISADHKFFPIKRCWFMYQDA